MKPVRADFTPHRPVSRNWWVAVASLAVLAAVLALATRHALLQAEAARLEATSSRAAKDAAARAHVPTMPPVPYDASAREMLAQHAIPWPGVLTALEAVQVAGVRVQNVDYSGNDATARVEVVFTAQSQVLDYVTELNAGLPTTGLAWRWTVLRIEQNKGDANGRALVVGRWAER